MAVPANDQSADEKILRQPNDDYIHSGQNSDVARYDEFLAEEFTVTLPGLVFRNRRPCHLHDRARRHAARSALHRHVPAQ
jgi:hypothetical protein